MPPETPNVVRAEAASTAPSRESPKAPGTVPLMAIFGASLMLLTAPSASLAAVIAPSGTVCATVALAAMTA